MQRADHRTKVVVDRRKVLGMAAAAASAGSLGNVMASALAYAAGADRSLTASEVVARIRAGDMKAEDYCLQALEAYREHKDLNAFAYLDEDRALEAAREVDIARMRGAVLAPLAGLPVAIKDNINTMGYPTSAGTSSLKAYRPTKNAPVAEALFKSGAILFGKTNMHELAQGGTSNNPIFGPVRNPYDKRRVAGGSSGGTAAAIAARIVPAGLGTDTAGSVRIPASFCGIAALRPSTGRAAPYSLDGVVPLEVTKDTIGLMARTIGDVALLHAAITGDQILAPTPLKGVRLGIPKTHYWEDLDGEVERVSREALEKLRGAGAVLVDVDMNEIVEQANKILFSLTDRRAEFADWLAKNVPDITYEDVLNGIATPTVKFRWSLQAVPAEIREKANAVREELMVKYAGVFQSSGIAALVFPTEILVAPLIRTAGETNGDTFEIGGKKIPEPLAIIRNTVSTAIYRAPAISLPAGLIGQGLPVGLELDGVAGGDTALLALARGVEDTLGPVPAPF